MTPETIAEIKSWPDMNEEEAKLLFIRRSATEAYEKDEIKEATEKILVPIVELATVANMNRESIGLHLANLDKARSYLAAFTQGLMIGYAKEEEPKFKARAEARLKEVKANRPKSESGVSTKDKRINDLIEMARNLSISGEGVKSSGSETKSSISNTVTKTECPNCKKQVFSIKFHKC